MNDENILICLSDNDLLGFEKAISGESNNNSYNAAMPVVYSKVDGQESILLKRFYLTPYMKVPEITVERLLFRLKQLIAMNGHYIPIIDDASKKVLFTESEYELYRKKLSGLKEYNAGELIISDNLEFDGLTPYLEQIDRNILEVNAKREPVVREFTRIMNEAGFSVSLGCNSGGDIELVEAGSTSRYTNVPNMDPNSKWDFDFTVRMDPSKVWEVKEILETKLPALGHITRTSNYKVRLTDVTIPGLSKPIDLDFSLTPQKEHYLSTEDALKEKLESARRQDEAKYRLILANIMYAKDYLKHKGAYKPSRGILDGDRSFGGIGAVGIENWILQNGGSFVDASREFLSFSEDKDFTEFEKGYAIIDGGQDHVSTSKHEFPFHNFVMKNMRYNGYYVMRDALKEFLDMQKEAQY